MYKWLKNWLKYKDGEKPDVMDTTPVVPIPPHPVHLAQIISMEDNLKDFDDEAHKRTHSDTSN